MTRDLKVVVLLGGRSSEREISLLTGEEVYSALLQKRYRAAKVDLDDNVVENLRREAPDAAFIALHGKYGEDGAVQGMLEVLGIPYTGSGVLASALCLNKLFSKRIFSNEGISTPSFVLVREDEWKENKGQVRSRIVKTFSLPVVVKPIAQGSSVGVSMVQEEKDLATALEIAFSYDEAALVEEYVDGREIQCGVLGNENPMALPLVEIVSKKRLFDYEAKYTPGLAEEITPAPLSFEESRAGQEMGLRAYKALGCAGFARVDMFLSSDRGFLVSEINTIPGLTKNSLFPKEAKAAGVEFPELISRIVELALERNARAKG